MENRLKYFIYPEYNLVIEFLAGNIGLEDYINLKRTEIADPRYKPTYNHVIDIRKSNILNSDVSLKGDLNLNAENYARFISATPELSAKRKSAFITITSEQVVATILYKSLNLLPMEMEVFSTVEAALKWLGNVDFDPDLYHPEQ